MTEQKQIEEMAKEDRINKLAKELCHAMYCHIKDEPTECYHGCKAYIYAFRAINAGYRKQIEGEWHWIADDSPMCNICGKVFDTNDDADAGLRILFRCNTEGGKVNEQNCNIVLDDSGVLVRAVRRHLDVSR